MFTRTSPPSGWECATGGGITTCRKSSCVTTRRSDSGQCQPTCSNHVCVPRRRRHNGSSASPDSHTGGVSNSTPLLAHVSLTDSSTTGYFAQHKFRRNHSYGLAGARESCTNCPVAAAARASSESSRALTSCPSSAAQAASGHPQVTKATARTTTAM